MGKTCFERVFELFRKSRTNTSIVACVVDGQQNLPSRLRQRASSLRGLNRPALRRDDVSLERATSQDSVLARRRRRAPFFHPSCCSGAAFSTLGGTFRSICCRSNHPNAGSLSSLYSCFRLSASSCHSTCNRRPLIGNESSTARKGAGVSQRPALWPS